MYKTVELDEEGGSLSGYIVSHSDNNYKHFLSEEIRDEKRLKAVIEFIEENQYDQILIIKNLNVEDEYQGQGIGRNLLEDAIGECSIALLIADANESQRDNFELEKFYEGSDFMTVSSEVSGPLMVFPGDEAYTLKEKLDTLVVKITKPKF
jgi:GNAT superfamily N-acetyltransferase